MFARYKGTPGLNNHKTSPSLFGHAAGAMTVVSDKLLMVGGRDTSGKFSINALIC